MLDLVYDSQHLRAWLLEDHLVVSKFPEPELHLWNPTAAVIWLLLLDGDKNLHEIAIALSKIYSDYPENSEAELHACLIAWTELGWVEITVSHRYSICQNIKHSACLSDKAEAETEAHKFSQSILKKNYCINNNVFNLSIQCQPDCNVQPFLSRLSSLLSGFMETSDDSKYRLEIGISNEAIYLSENLQNYSKFQTQSDALSHCIQFFLKVSSNNSANFITLHAAGIGKDHALILPGISGSGKSTLCALLATKGWEYYGDDLIGLAVNEKSEGYLVPFPTGVSVKADNWDLLAKDYPKLEHLEVIQYGDKVAKFLSIPNLSATSKQGKLIKSIIFPTYSDNSKTSYIKLSVTETLTKLVNAGVSLHKDMKPEEVEQFLNFFMAHPVYQLIYSDIEEVNTWLSTLVRN